MPEICIVLTSTAVIILPEDGSDALGLLIEQYHQFEINHQVFRHVDAYPAYDRYWVELYPERVIADKRPAHVR